MSLLLPKEAGDFVICHPIPLLRSRWHRLQEANHGLIALRIEFSVISSLHLQEVRCPIFLRIFRNVALDIILEVGEKSQTVLKLHSERLIINRRPSSRDMLGGAVRSILAENSFDLRFVHQLYFPNVFVCERELLVLSDNLKLIRQLMGANFVNFEQVYFLRLLTDMECPNSVHLPSKTVNRLIGINCKRRAIIS